MASSVVVTAFPLFGRGGGGTAAVVAPSSAVTRCRPGASDLISAPDLFQENGSVADTLLKEQLRIQVTENHPIAEVPPIVRALDVTARQNGASFDFPAHNRGRGAPSSLTQLIGSLPFRHDFSELPGSDDNLFRPKGAILEAQTLAAELFGASKTWFLVGGTSCGIAGAIMATCCPGDSLILPRNCHISAISGMVISGAVPKYIIPEYNTEWGVSGGMTPHQVETAIRELEQEGRKPAAVFVTSPTYNGVCSNLKQICKICHQKDIPVIVDEAHGAHFAFHSEFPETALEQGADIAVQSTHKVLCSLTQSSMLHASGNRVDKDRINTSLRALQTTSPSYLLLASLDAARAQLSDKKETAFNQVLDLAMKARMSIMRIPGISLLDGSTFKNFSKIDPMRITVSARHLGLTGFETDETLYAIRGIVSELTESHTVTYCLSLGTCKEHVHRLVAALEHLSQVYPYVPDSGVGKTATNGACLPLVGITMGLTPREAFFAAKTRVDIKDSIGKVVGEAVCPYPPGVPMLIPGEVITSETLDKLDHLVSQGACITGASDPSLSTILVCDL